MTDFVNFNSYMYLLQSIVMLLTGIIRDCLKDPGLKNHYILTASFNHNPLENFFGKVRQSGGWSSKLSSKMVQEATDVIRLQSDTGGSR